MRPSSDAAAAAAGGACDDGVVVQLHAELVERLPDDPDLDRRPSGDRAVHHRLEDVGADPLTGQPERSAEDPAGVRVDA